MINKFKKGLSIIETVIITAVFTVVVGILVASILYFYRVNSFNVEQAFAVSSARKGVETMTRNLREATYADDGAYPVLAISSTTVTFFSDIDHDDNVERIRFFMDGDTFKKGTLKSSGDPLEYSGSEEVSIISENVRNLEEDTSIFNYFNSSGVEITDYSNISDVSFIKVSLIVNVNPIRLPNEFTLRGTATLRNLKTNL